MMPASTNFSLTELRRAVDYVKARRSEVLTVNQLDQTVFDSWVGAADLELSRERADQNEMLSALRVITTWTRGIARLAEPTAVLNRACGVNEGEAGALSPVRRRIARQLWEQNATTEEIAGYLGCSIRLVNDAVGR